MKISRYVTIIPLGNGTTLLYGARKDSFVIVHKNLDTEGVALSEILDEDSGTDCIKMTEAGIFIEDDLDEVSELRDRISEVDGDGSVYHLHINPTLDCNFRCWYCYEEHMKDSMMSQTIVDAVCCHIRSELSGVDSPEVFQLSFFGGEPLLGFDTVVKPIISVASEQCALHDISLGISFTTNGYLIDEEMSEYFKNLPVSFQITLDGHRDFHDRTRFPRHGGGPYDRILRNIETLAGNGALVIVRVNYTLANISSLMDLCDDLTGLNEIAKSHITVNIQRVWQDCEDGEVDTEGMVHAALKKLSATGIKCNSHLDLEMVNNSCYGDKRRYALINYDGNVFRCTARDFKPEQRSGILHVDGHVEWDEEYVSRRMSVKMSRPQCVECRIAPLCGGGCRQKALETPEDVACLHGYSEEEKVRRVMNRFEACFMNR